MAIRDPSSPGNLLREWLDVEQISITVLAEDIGIARQQCSRKRQRRDEPTLKASALHQLRTVFGYAKSARSLNLEAGESPTTAQLVVELHAE